MCAHLFGSAASEVSVKRDALDRRFGMQLEGQPCHVDESLLFQLFDSDRVDVAPGSNVVRENDELDRLGCLIHPQSRTVTGRTQFLSARLGPGWEGIRPRSVAPAQGVHEPGEQSA